MDQKIVSAVLEIATGKGFDIRYPDGSYPEYGSARLVMELSDGSKDILEYYHDEISIQPSEVVGKTVSEAYALKGHKDKVYLQGGC